MTEAVNTQTGEVVTYETHLAKLVERNGQYLLLECKAGSVIGLERGQHLTYKRLARDKHFTVFVLHGARNMPVRLTIFHPDGRIEAGIPTSIDDVRCRVMAWAAFADRQQVA